MKRSNKCICVQCHKSWGETEKRALKVRAKVHTILLHNFKTRFCPDVCYQESMENSPSPISQLTLIKFIAFELQVNFATLFSSPMSEILSTATSEMQRRSECLEDVRNVLLVFPITIILHHRPAIDWLTIKLTLFCLSMSASAFN